MVHLHVAGHVAVYAAEHLELFHGEEAPEGEDRVEGGGAVALGHDKAVTVGVAGVLGIDAHDVKVQGGEGVEAAQRAAGMAGGCAVHHFHGIEPGLGGGERQLVAFDLIHTILPLHKPTAKAGAESKNGGY